MQGEADVTLGPWFSGLCPPELPSPGETLLPVCSALTQAQGAADTGHWALRLGSSGDTICTSRASVWVPLCVPILGARSDRGHCLGLGDPSLAPPTAAQAPDSLESCPAASACAPRAEASGMCGTRSQKRSSDRSSRSKLGVKQPPDPTPAVQDDPHHPSPHLSILQRWDLKQRPRHVPLEGPLGPLSVPVKRCLPSGGHQWVLFSPCSSWGQEKGVRGHGNTHKGTLHSPNKPNQYRQWQEAVRGQGSVLKPRGISASGVRPGW